jgi:hypothetical protein
MDGLIRLLVIAFRCLAGTEESEKSALEIEADEVLHRYASVTHAEPTIERFVVILDSMACDVNKFGVMELTGSGDFGGSGLIVFFHRNSGSARAANYFVNLFFDLP